MNDIAAMLVAPMIVFGFVGYYVDQLMNHQIPYCMIIGFILGVVTGFWSVYKKYGT